MNKIRRPTRVAPHPRRRSRTLFLALLAAATVVQFPSAALGQAVVRETQVALDADGTIFELTPTMRSAAGLFPEVQNFQVARLFRQDDGTIVLEVASQAGQTVTRERRTLSQADVAAFRQSLSTALAASDTAPALDREGRGGLVWGATGLGLGFYGWAVPVAFDIQDKGAVAAYLLTAGSSFYLPYRLTRDRSVSDAHRFMSLWGATRGALYGGALAYGITERGGSSDDDFEDDDEDWRARWGTAMAGSILGGVIGFKAVDWTDIDHGTASLRGTLGDFATAAGFGTSYVAGLYDGDIVQSPQGPFEDDADLLPANAVALGIGAAGLFASQWVGDGGTYTVGDVHVFRSFGILGAQALLPIAGLIDDDDSKTYAAAAIIGAGPGLFVGSRMLRGQSFSSGNGLLVAAGHLAGGLLGAGVTYLVDSDASDGELLYFTTSALGSAAGLIFTYRALADSPGSAALPDRDQGPGSGPQVTVNTAGLVPLFGGGRPDGRSIRSSLVTIRW